MAAGFLGNGLLLRFAFKCGLRKTMEDEFLFGPDIVSYLHELYGKAVDVHSLEGALDEEPKKQRVAALKWFSGQGDEAKRKFGRYLAFKD